MSEKTYRIGEAAARLNLKTYVLRFWEMEFPQIAPIRTEKGQRLYRERDLALLRRIRYLLHERGLTIEGARKILREEAARGEEYKDAELAMPEDAQDAALHDDAFGGDDSLDGLLTESDMEDESDEVAGPEQKGRTKDEEALASRVAPGLFFREESARWSGSAAPPHQEGLLPDPALAPAPALTPVLAGERAGTLPTADIRMIMDELEDIRRLLARGGNGGGT